LDDFINRSKAQTALQRYSSHEKGSEMLDVKVDEALIYDGEHFYPNIKVPYLKELDTKLTNPPIFVPKNVPNNVLN
jgi:hypothetical protein